MKKRKIFLLFLIYLFWLGIITSVIVTCHLFFPQMPWIGWLSVFLVILIVNLWLAISIFNSKKWEQVAKSRWLFIIIFFPVFGFVFLHLFGFNRTKWNNKINEKVFSIKSIKNPRLNHQKNNIFVSQNQFRFIESKKQSDECITKLIKEAKKLIVIQINLVDKDVFTNKYFPLLLEAKKAKNNLDIYIMYDLRVEIPYKIIRTLKKNNIYLKCFKPKNVAKIFFNVLMVNSMLIIDNSIAVVGNSIWDKKEPNELIFHYCISGPNVQTLLNIFINYWQTATDKKQKEVLSKLDNLLLMKIKNVQLDYKIQSQCQYCASFPHFQNLFNTLFDALYNAKKSIKIITNNFIPITHIKSALESALIKNIDVKIIQSSCIRERQKQISNYFCKILVDNKSLYELNQKIDCNFIIIDDNIVIITPLNYNYASLFLHQQTIMWLKDKKQFFAKYFNNLLKHAVLTKPIKFTKWQRFLNGCYNIFYPLFYVV